MDTDSTPQCKSGFERSILRQIELNRARTPTQRFLALCDLLNATRAMAPMDPEARLRRLRAQAAREHEREHWRAECSRLAAAIGQTLQRAFEALAGTI